MPPPLQPSSSPESGDSSDTSEEDMVRRRIPSLFCREACRKSRLEANLAQPSTPQRSSFVDNRMLSPSQRSTVSAQSTASYEDVLEDMEVRLQVAKENFNESKSVVSDVVKESKVAKKVVVNLNTAIKALKNINK